MKGAFVVNSHLQHRGRANCSTSNEFPASRLSAVGMLQIGDDKEADALNCKGVN
jgi:hypothetical protein